MGHDVSVWKRPEPFESGGQSELELRTCAPDATTDGRGRHPAPAFLALLFESNADERHTTADDFSAS